MEHSHPHVHHDAPRDTAEVRAMLRFMIDHNDHHNDELADLLDALPERAQKLLLRAIGSFEAANVELKEVLNELD